MAVDGKTARLRSYTLIGFLGCPPIPASPDALRFKTRVRELKRPASLLAFVCENEDSIEDGLLAFYAAPSTQWLNLPTSRHGQGGTFSFVDGHVEYWRWKSGM